MKNRLALAGIFVAVAAVILLGYIYQLPKKPAIPSSSGRVNLGLSNSTQSRLDRIPDLVKKSSVIISGRVVAIENGNNKEFDFAMVQVSEVLLGSRKYRFLRVVLREMKKNSAAPPAFKRGDIGIWFLSPPPKGLKNCFSGLLLAGDQAILLRDEIDMEIEKRTGRGNKPGSLDKKKPR